MSARISSMGFPHSSAPTHRAGTHLTVHSPTDIMTLFSGSASRCRSVTSPWHPAKARGGRAAGAARGAMPYPVLELRDGLGCSSSRYGAGVNRAVVRPEVNLARVHARLWYAALGLGPALDAAGAASGGAAKAADPTGLSAGCRGSGSRPAYTSCRAAIAREDSFPWAARRARSTRQVVEGSRAAA